MRTVTLPALEDGQVLCKVKYFANDAGQRGFISSTISDERLYVSPVHTGTPMRSGVLAEGLTAWTGLLYAGREELPRRDLTGKTVVVSAACGATGSMVVQEAAKMLGAARVVGIAGSDEKCAWVKKIGATECVNYKFPTFLEDLGRATPDEVDPYYDNVGGAVLDAVLPRMKRLGKGTVVVCGAIGEYNNAAGKAMGLRNWCEVFSARINIRGFITLDYLQHVPEGMQELIKAAADGRLDLEDAETLVEARLEEQPAVWMRM